MSIPDEGYCDKCRTRSLLTERGACVWCLHQVVPRVRKKPTKPLGPPVRLSPELVDEALGLYETGRSLRSVARELMPRSAYASTRSMSQSLGREFRKRGVRLRSHVEQAVIQGRKQERIAEQSPQAARARLERLVAGLPERDQCSATTNDGRRCRLSAEIGSDVCHMHSPANAEAVARRVAAMHAARDEKIGAAA